MPPSPSLFSDLVVTTSVIKDSPPMTLTLPTLHTTLEITEYSHLLVYGNPNSLSRILCLMFANLQIHQNPAWCPVPSCVPLATDHSSPHSAGENATVLGVLTYQVHYAIMWWSGTSAPGSGHVGGNPSSKTLLTLRAWVVCWACLSLSFLICL